MAERRESVRLELHDAGFSTSMVRAAASTGLLERALKSLDGTTINIHERISESATSVDNFGRSAKNADGSINQLTGRLRVLGEVAAILGPTLGPLGGVGIAGVSGLASQLGFAAVAGGVLIGSLQGVGDALGAMNKAQLDPTNKNLENAEDALKRLSPAARDFAEAAFDLKPALMAIRDMGQEALMPGLTESLDNLERLGPKVADIFETIAGVSGDLAADITGSFASERWADFFAFIEREAPDAITELATTVGDLTHGMSELWEAFTPLNDGFSSWLMGVADGFDEWATGLSATEGFAEFVDYIQTTGPQVADTLGALGGALVQIVQASAPLGGPVLAGIEAFADVVSAIADSDLGTPIMAGVTALALLNRSLAVTASLPKVSMSAGLFGGLGAASKGVKGQAGSIKADIAAMSDGLVVFGSNADKAGEAAGRMKQRLAAGAGLAGLAVAASGAADGLGLTNTMSLALMGSLGGPPGIALGAAAGALLDMKSAGEGATEAIQGLDAAVQSGDVGVLSEQIAAAKAELADITDLDFGGDIFDRIGFQVADTFGGPSMDDARRKIEESEKALEDLEWAEKRAGIEAKGAALEFLSATDANVDLGKWSRKSTESIKAQADAIVDTQEAAQKTAESFVNLGESLNDGKKSLGDWIKEMSDSADALRNFTANSRRAAEKGLNEGLIASLQEAGEEGARRMRQLANASEGEIERANGAWRKGKQAMKEYNDFKVPPKKVTADTSRAMQSFREVDTYLSNLNGKTATTYVNTVRTVTGPKGAAAFSQQADGSVLDFYADGGVAENHVAQIAPAGSWRVWAEPETGGEAYIPLAPAKRERSVDIWEQVGSRLGVQFERFADGGTTDDDDDKKKRRKRKFHSAEYTRDDTGALQRSIDRLTDAAEIQTLVTEGQTDAVENSTRVAEEAAEEMERWADKMADVASATTAGFGTGLFERDSNPWASGAGGGPLANLNKDIAGLEERGGLQSQLAAMGISGDALAAMLSEGTNADLTALINSGQAPAVAAAYAQRAALQGSVGAAGGQAAYGTEYAAAAAAAAAADKNAQKAQAELERQTSHLRVLETQIMHQTGQLAQMEQRLASNPVDTGREVGAAINGAAAQGQRNRGSGGGPR